MTAQGVQRFELGPRIAERVRSFESAYDRGCGHDAGQWAAIGALRSSCLDCLRAAGPVAPWERAGVCDVCGRAMAAPSMTWAVGTSVGAVAVVRLCGDCRAEQVLAESEAEHEENVMTDRTAITRRLARMGLAGPGGAIIASAAVNHRTLDCCENCYQSVETAAATGPAVRLHRECREGLATLFVHGLNRKEARSREQRIVNARGMLTVARAEVAS